MKYFLIIVICLVFGFFAAFASRVQDPHQFTEEECGQCHFGNTDIGAALKPMISARCEKCHPNRKQTLSHPIDITPQMSIPDDLHLAEGKLSCSTCHFTHLASVQNKRFNYKLLRRPERGITFCIACHEIDAKGHILYEKVHQGSFKETGVGGTLDTHTLQCLECHDKYLTKLPRSLGEGTWNHFTTRLSHPVGAQYIKAAAKNPNKYKPYSILPKEIRLMNGKVGCGTCHNVYSKQKYMLVMNNHKSKLCLSCHIK